MTAITRYLRRRSASTLMALLLQPPAPPGALDGLLASRPRPGRADRAERDCYGEHKHSEQ